MANQLLITLVNSILGEGVKKSRDNIAYFCPHCYHAKRKLEICFTESKEGINKWACWNCGDSFKGKKLINLFKRLNVSDSKIKELKQYVKVFDYYKIENQKQESSILELPKEYKSLENTSSLISKHALVYLKNRNITQNDIIKYNIGYCEYGYYQNRIILPSLDLNGKLNYFTARSFEEDPYEKYKNPPITRNIIPFEFYINWNLPIILVEGIMDAIAIKRNAIPLLGKNIQPNLMKKLLESNVKKIYIALDSDAIKQSLKHCEILLNEGKEVYLVKLEGKEDLSEIGFERSINLLHKQVPLTLSKLMEYKLEMI